MTMDLAILSFSLLCFDTSLCFNVASRSYLLYRGRRASTCLDEGSSLPSAVTGNGSTSSLFECGMLCLQDGECYMANYDVESGECEFMSLGAAFFQDSDDDRETTVIFPLDDDNAQDGREYYL